MDHARFIASNDTSIRNDKKNEYNLHFDQIAGSLSRLVAEVATKKLNVGATTSEITNYLGCMMRRDGADYDLREGLTEFTNAPAVLIPQTANPPQAIVATYPLVGYPRNENWGAIAPSRPIVQCFAKKGSQWSLVGELGGDYSKSTFSIYPLTSPVQGQAWSLLAGMRIGDTGARLLLEVVVCDGKSFTKKWSRGELEGGKVESVDGNAVLVTYSKLFVDGRRVFETDPIRYGEVLHVTPNGLE